MTTQYIPGCDMAECGRTTGELRVLPEVGESNSIICQRCHSIIMRWRVVTNRERKLEGDCRFPYVPWSTLRVYDCNPIAK